MTIAACYGALQHVAACCSVLQRVAACCSVSRLSFECIQGPFDFVL